MRKNLKINQFQVSFFALMLVLFVFTYNAIGQNTQVGTNVGQIAPEIELTDPNGKTISLSDLRGKIVLIDFWASWCRPCRAENPNVVSAYQKYSKAKLKNAKGFEVYSVSLDRSKEAWMNAIQQDGLTWDYHVSDLKYWNNKAAQDYRVNSIPTNFLIDANGKIIARGLRGPALHKELDKYVESF